MSPQCSEINKKICSINNFSCCLQNKSTIIFVCNIVSILGTALVFYGLYGKQINLCKQFVKIGSGVAGGASLLSLVFLHLGEKVKPNLKINVPKDDSTIKNPNQHTVLDPPPSFNTSQVTTTNPIQD